MRASFTDSDLESMAGSDFGSDAGSSQAGFPEDWQRWPYHRMVGRKMRTFRLVPLGTTTGPGTICSLCGCGETDEDPLYPGYQIEWLYYKQKNPALIDGTVCHYSGVAHRLRYKAWTRQELTEDLKNDEFRKDFAKVQQNIIEQKKSGRIDLDMSSVPMPPVCVSKERAARVSYEAPDEEVVTEAAFKKRLGG